jgi:hypothetical protein
MLLFTAHIHLGPLTGIGYALCAEQHGQPNIASDDLLRSLLRDVAAKVAGHRFTPQFLFGEWRDVAHVWQLGSREA